LVGPNGAGKTTLLKLILGLLVPDSGEIRFFGRELSKCKDWSKISYVPQKATGFDVNFPIKVEEVVLMGRAAQRGLGRPYSLEDKKQARLALERVGLWSFKDRLIGDLSGGQQQRVFLARALAGEPRLLFLDEPVTGIDQASQEEIYALLRELNRQEGLTLILVSHDIERILAEAMHIACLNQTLVCHASPAEFIKESESGDILGQNLRFLSHYHHH